MCFGFLSTGDSASSASAGPHFGGSKSGARRINTKMVQFVLTCKPTWFKSRYKITHKNVETLSVVLESGNPRQDLLVIAPGSVTSRVWVISYSYIYI